MRHRSPTQAACRARASCAATRSPTSTRRPPTRPTARAVRACAAGARGAAGGWRRQRCSSRGTISSYRDGWLQANPVPHPNPSPFTLTLTLTLTLNPNPNPNLFPTAMGGCRRRLLLAFSDDLFRRPRSGLGLEVNYRQDGISLLSSPQPNPDL